MKLRRQMILLIALPTLVIYVVILGLAMVYTYRESKGARQRSMTDLSVSYASRFDGQLREVARIAETTASFMKTVGPLPDEKVYQQLERDVAQSQLVYGAAMAFEPGAVKPADLLFAPYVCRQGESFRRINIDRSVYDWYRDPNYTWYTAPKKAGRGLWSDPYFDQGAGNILMATYSAVFNLNGKFGGVATVDVDLPRLHRTVSGDFPDGLDFVILSRDGRYVYDSDSSRILRKTIFDIAAEKKNPDLADLGRQMLGGASGMGVIHAWDSPQKQWVFYAPIRSTNWVFACRFPERLVMADVKSRTAAMGGALGITLLLIILCIAFAARLIIAPIEKLKEKVLEVGQGNLDVQIDQTSRTEELRHLASSFNQMTAQLRVHIKQLGEEQAARARVERDLAIAREIQQSLLPAGDPLNERLEIAGRSRYCDQTGGDYYDFIDIAHSPAGTTLIAIGDVTGHGIAAALLMASARAALRVGAADVGQLSQMMNKVNRLLTSDKLHDKFMTMTLLTIDPQHLKVRWSSAGHDPAIVFHPDDGSFEELDGGEIPLGIDIDVQYVEYESNSLRSGDILLLGTDGIWETRNANDELFGKDRLRELIRGVSSHSAKEIAQEIEQQLDRYRGHANAEDDITFVLIRLK